MNKPILFGNHDVSAPWCPELSINLLQFCKDNGNFYFIGGGMSFKLSEIALINRLDWNQSDGRLLLICQRRESHHPNVGWFPMIDFLRHHDDITFQIGFPYMYFDHLRCLYPLEYPIDVTHLSIELFRQDLPF